MPLGAARLNTLARYAAPVGAAARAIYTGYFNDAWGQIVLAAPFDKDYTDVSQTLKDIGGYTLTTQSTVTTGTNTELVADQVYWPDAYTKSAEFGVNGWTSGNAGAVYTLGTSIPASSSGTFLIEFWAYALDSTANRNWCISSSDVGGRFLFGINNSTSSNFGNENNIGIGTGWHHVAISCTGGTKRVHVDGTYKGQWISSNTGFTDLHVGQFNAGDLYDFRGYIQDLRVYVGTSKNFTQNNTVDDTSEPIIAAYSSDNARLCSTIFSHHPQYTGTRSTVGKFNVGGNDGSMYYNVVSSTGERTRVIINADAADGGDARLSSDNQWTIEFWWKTNSADMWTRSGLLMSTNESDFNYASLDTTDEVSLGFSYGGQMQCLVDGSYIYGNTSGQLSINTWYHEAIVCDGAGNVKWYHDGVLKGTVTGKSFINYSFAIGCGYMSSNSMTSSTYAYFDEIRVSNVQRYTSNFSVPTAVYVDDADTIGLFHITTFDDVDDITNGVA
jgi:hypothetical protein